VRKLETLITLSRRITENQEFTDTAGIQDDEFIQFFNDGQEEIHALINQNWPHVLMGSKTFDLVSNQEAYDIPDDVYLGTRIDFVEFSKANPDYFYALKKGSLKERLNGIQGDPSFYIRNGTQLLIQPKPQSNSKLRITYQKAIPRLDLKRGVILSFTTSGNQITALSLDPNEFFDRNTLLEDNYITVADKYGNVTMRKIPISDVSSSGVVTIEAGFEFEDGETLAIGDYVYPGKYTSNFSALPDICEKGMLEYVNTRIKIRDSDSDAAAIAQVLERMLNTLNAAFAEPDNDPDYVPVLDGQYLGWDSY
jgi:hypothetical protein